MTDFIQLFNYTLYNEKNTTVANISKQFNISKRTFYRYLEKNRVRTEK